MRIGALITAAGASSQTGQFKPMLNIGSISVAQRVVTTFQQAGVDRIVMVTGHNATALERHLSGNGIIFLRNEDYANTHMFESVKIGLEYLKDKCDAVITCPVGIPLFTASTVTALMTSNAKLACPLCQGRTGHPILIDATLIDRILADSGEDGLRGALSRIGVSMVPVPVDDPGILRDAGISGDYTELLQHHNRQLVRPVVTVSLAREKCFLDNQVAMLLMLIDETKSVRAAGKRMQLSYSSCWNMIRTLENQLNDILVERSQGGAKGSTSVLTPQGRLLLERYNAYEQKLREQAQTLYEAFFGELFE